MKSHLAEAKRNPEFTSGEVDKANADLTEEARNMYLDYDLTRRTWDIESRGEVSLFSYGSWSIENSEAGASSSIIYYQWYSIQYLAWEVCRIVISSYKPGR